MKGILFYQSIRQLLLIILATTFFTYSPISLPTLLSTPSNQNTLKNGVILPKEPTPLDPSSFTYRITSSKESIIYFFKCYNNSYYTERVLPCFFMHVDDLLANTGRHKDPYIYIKNVFSLFHERLTACNWVNPIAFTWLLEQLSLRLESYFKNAPSLKDALSATLEGKLTLLENSKDKKNITIKCKVEALTEEILGVLKDRNDALATQMLIIRFLENCLCKLLWDARDDVYAWKAFKLLGLQLEQLYQHSIIPDQTTLNHLLWSLVNRFIYWISELEGSAISLTCYQQIIQELSGNKLSFLHHKEQRQAITPKKAKLLKAIETGYAKAYFYHKQGTITDPLPR